MAVSIQDRTDEFRSILALEKRKAGARANAPKRKPGRSLNQNSLWNKPASSSTHADRQPLLDGSEPAGPGAGEWPGAAAAVVDERTNFSRRAGVVAGGVVATVTKLERLSQLARQRSLFDDKAGEIQWLTQAIKQDLDAIGADVQALQKRLADAKSAGSGGLFGGGGGGSSSSSGAAGTDADGPMTEDELAHNGKVVGMLQEGMLTIASSFREVLEVRTKNMQASSSRTAALISAGAGGMSGLVGADSASPLYGGPRRAQSSRPGPPARQGPPGLPGGPEPDAGESLTLEMPGQRPSSTSHQLALLEEGQTSREYLQERGKAVQNIETMISELGHMFGQITTMVQEQGEMVERIDANTEAVMENVAGAHRELTKYWNRVNSNRLLLMKMGGTLMVFFLLWVLLTG